MDYLDSGKELRHRVLLFVGYVLIAIAIVIAALILLYQAYGFGLGKDGTVIQNGLTFFSSQPSPAKIYVNGELKPVATNTRLALPAGIYQIKLTRNGYHDWHRGINLEGGKVQHYDYPFLFPKALTTKKVQNLAAAPHLMTQSPDHRWLLLQPADNMTDFTVYDLKSPDKPGLTINLPAGLMTKATASEGWQLAEWADDNQHVLLRHDYDGKSEFILVDRADAAKSLNLNSTLAITAGTLSLRDKKYDQYYLYETAAGALKTVSLKNATAADVLSQVLAFKSYGNDTLLYVTDSGAPAGKVLLKLAAGKQSQTVRRLPAGTSYVVDLTKYSGVMYVAAGAAADNRVYIYKDPAGQLAERPGQAPAPQQVLHVDQVNYLSFSASAQFIMAENGSRFGVYDIENTVGFNYTAPAPLDPPQSHATWMDGNRLVYVSGGRLNVFDYDNLNRHALVAADANYLPAFTPDYKAVYLLSPAAGGQYELARTSLLAKADK
jgi:hypothetical protein